MKLAIMLLLSLALIAAACTSTQGGFGRGPADTDSVNQAHNVDENLQVVADGEIQFLEDGTPYLINPNRIRSGGPPKDGIPSIDDPQFVSVEQADRWLSGEEFGMAISHNGVERFYPFQILVWHEIVNDNVAGDAVLITYCPLCGSGIAFDPTIDGEAVEFGTSGKLFNSNLVMYDRKTDTYWNQIGGRAIIGPLTGRELPLFPSSVTTWEEWSAQHPNGEVLSRETGQVRPYGQDPYGGYYTDNSLYFPVDENDDRLHRKAVVFATHIDGIPVAYPESVLDENDGLIEDTVGSINVRVERNDDGTVRIFNADTNDEIAYERDFWFAWFAFNTDTLLYGVE